MRDAYGMVSRWFKGLTNQAINLLKVCFAPGGIVSPRSMNRRSDAGFVVKQLIRQVNTYELFLSGIAKATNQLLTDSSYVHGVNTALASLGQATEVDRVYIFEGLWCVNILSDRSLL